MKKTNTLPTCELERQQEINYLLGVKAKTQQQEKRLDALYRLVCGDTMPQINTNEQDYYLYEQDIIY